MREEKKTTLYSSYNSVFFMSLPFVFCCFSLVRFKEKKTLDFVQNFEQIEIKKNTDK